MPDDLIVDYTRPLDNSGWTWTIIDRAKSRVVTTGTADSLPLAKEAAVSSVQRWATSTKALAVVREAHIIHLITR